MGSRTGSGASIKSKTRVAAARLASRLWNAWAKGCTWGELEAHTGASDGDMVRFFRLALQLLKNTMYALPKDDPLRDKLRGAAHRINRDVVDAERQLRLGTPEIAPPPPAALESPPPAMGSIERPTSSEESDLGGGFPG